MHKEIRAKTVMDSYTEQVHILVPGNMNGTHRLFGGQLMQWIDVVAGVTARRHSECNVTTVLVDKLEFKKPAYINDTIVLEGQVTYVGKTSMEVRVHTYTENLNGTKTLINTAYLIMVALDENERPTEVPKLILKTDEEKKEWEAAERRKALRSKK